MSHVHFQNHMNSVFVKNRYRYSLWTYNLSVENGPSNPCRRLLHSAMLQSIHVIIFRGDFHICFNMRKRRPLESSHRSNMETFVPKHRSGATTSTVSNLNKPR